MKILTGFPTSDDKLYCIDDFINGLESSVDRKDVVVVDTSEKSYSLLDYYKDFTYIYHYAEKAMDRVVEARNIIVEYAIEKGYDYVFFIDSDAILKPNQLEHLAMQNKDVVSAVLMTIYPNMWIGPVPFLAKHRRMSIKNIETGLLKAYRIGFGGVLINIDVLKKIPIRCKRNKKGIMTLSEDFCFSDDCREQGIDLYVDSDVQIEHRIVGQWDYNKC